MNGKRDMIRAHTKNFRSENLQGIFYLISSTIRHTQTATQTHTHTQGKLTSSFTKFICGGKELNEKKTLYSIYPLNRLEWLVKFYSIPQILIIQ